MPRLNRSQFKFREYDTIGAEGAEEDVEFLQECFVDTGALAVLRDTGSTRCVVVGRTGTGKTALLTKLQSSADHAARIEPDQLSLQFLANSTILRYLETLSVNLDLFYRLLWRHVLVVELIQLRYHLRSEKDQENFLARIREKVFGDKKRTEALNYLVEWGKRFWEDTELRIHEVTQKLEEDVKASLGAKASLLKAAVDSAQEYSVEDKQEIFHRAQDVVNAVQIAKLADVIKLLAEEVFNDPQKRYHILIDRLDENWVPDPLRYRLIRSLIEAVRDLRQIKNAKIVVAIRRDLLDRVFRYTRDAGFQEEKYQAFLLPLTWSDQQLLEVVDRRLNKLVQRRYSGAPVSWKDLFPSEMGKQSMDGYLLERTHNRPRDIIQFANTCISLATDRPDISASIVRDAEGEYSRLRLRSLADEWTADYPRLLDIVGILRNRPASFPFDDLTDQQLQDQAFRLLDFKPVAGDRLLTLATELVEEKIAFDEFRRRLIRVFYDVGLVGLRVEHGHGTSWSFTARDAVNRGELGPDSRVVICPVFYRALSTKLRE